MKVGQTKENNSQSPQTKDTVPPGTHLFLATKLLKRKLDFHKDMV